MNKRTISQLVRPSIAILKPYSSARDEFKGEASVFLDANESPYNSPFNRYPDPYQRKLKERISEIKGVGHTNIFLGNGSDEPIDLLIRAFCEPAHDNIITLSPTYGMYQVAASVNNVEVKEVWLDDDFSTSHKKLLAESTPNSKLMFLCSPNNPTGNSIERDELVRTIEGFDGIVVVDEAYIDFASQASLLKEIEKHPNLVILQTFSKGWAMAGIRLGMAFASEEIISILNKIKYPYNINILAQEKALELLNTIDTQQWITTTIKERERVKNEMQKLDCITKVFASDANFLLAKTTDAATMYTFLAQHGIVARNRSGVRGCLNCIRFTIGSPGENDTLLEVLKEYETNHQKNEKKVLFIDRDGTIIVEPPTDYQVDSLEKLSFYPGAITSLAKIRENTDFEFVMVTNQDGLGTDSFPEDTFWPAHNKMLATLDGEGISFDDICIDRSFEHEKLPTRKPGLGMLQKYLAGDYDMAGSYVIGDRATDIELAKTLAQKAIWLHKPEDMDKLPSDLAGTVALATTSWKEIGALLLKSERRAKVKRTTSETDIDIEINLDGTGQCNISTGLGFFDHMLQQIGRHSGCDLTIKVSGDLHIDEHHTMEDTALALGEALKKALGDKRGIERYGFCLPMDDCLCTVALDFGGRPWLVWDAEFKREKIGDMPTEMFMHFFKSLSDAALMNLNIKAEGTNEHHKIEGIFKALAKAIKMAIRKDQNNNQLPSTKGVL